MIAPFSGKLIYVPGAVSCIRREYNVRRDQIRRANVVPSCDNGADGWTVARLAERVSR